MAEIIKKIDIKNTYIPLSLLGIVIVGATTWTSSINRIEILERSDTAQSILIEKNESGIERNKENTVILQTQFQYIRDALEDIKDSLKKIE